MGTSNNKKVDLIMFMGQSNMAGRGNAADAPVVPEGAAYEFRAISDPTRLYPLAEPFGVHENNPASGVNESKKTGSMVSSFALAYHQAVGRPVVGVSCSIGGTSINQWLPGGGFLNDAITRYHAARNWLIQNGYTIAHQFMVWCQGETDGDKRMPGEEYTRKVTSMMDAMMAAGLERCYLVRIGNHRDDPERYQKIMAAQTALCQAYEHAVLVSTKFASMAAEGLMKDPFHYVQEAYNIVGNEAGSNTALHILTGKVPFMYNPQNLHMEGK
ncbi:MAG: hypothetical protein K0Q90_498 [Paenibacillaceae bacterium]|nr:hypothetical protein [Paenibacillaceae bacterium]